MDENRFTQVNWSPNNETNLKICCPFIRLCEQFPFHSYYISQCTITQTDFYTSHLELNCFSRLVFRFHPCVLPAEMNRKMCFHMKFIYTEFESLYCVCFMKHSDLMCITIYLYWHPRRNWKRDSFFLFCTNSNIRLGWETFPLEYSSNVMLKEGNLTKLRWKLFSSTVWFS